MGSNFLACIKEETIYYGKHFLDTKFSSLEKIKIQNSSVKISFKNVVFLSHKTYIREFLINLLKIFH